LLEKGFLYVALPAKACFLAMKPTVLAMTLKAVGFVLLNTGILI
jgi:hypothetical protein